MPPVANFVWPTDRRIKKQYGVENNIYYYVPGVPVARGTRETTVGMAEDQWSTRRVSEHARADKRRVLVRYLWYAICVYGTHMLL